MGRRVRVRGSGRLGVRGSYVRGEVRCERGVM